jgi:hypothetical protein
MIPLPNRAKEILAEPDVGRSGVYNSVLFLALRAPIKVVDWPVVTFPFAPQCHG